MSANFNTIFGGASRPDREGERRQGGSANTFSRTGRTINNGGDRPEHEYGATDDRRIDRRSERHENRRGPPLREYEDADRDTESYRDQDERRRYRSPGRYGEFGSEERYDSRRSGQRDDFDRSQDRRFEERRPTRPVEDQREQARRPQQHRPSRRTPGSRRDEAEEMESHEDFINNLRRRRQDQGLDELPLFANRPALESRDERRPRAPSPPRPRSPVLSQRFRGERRPRAPSPPRPRSPLPRRRREERRPRAPSPPPPRSPTPRPRREEQPRQESHEDFIHNLRRRRAEQGLEELPFFNGRPALGELDQSRLRAPSPPRPRSPSPRRSDHHRHYEPYPGAHDRFAGVEEHFDHLHEQLIHMHEQFSNFNEHFADPGEHPADRYDASDQNMYDDGPVPDDFGDYLSNEADIPDFPPHLHPASGAAINNLPTKQVSATDQGEDGKATCPICMEDVAVRTTVSTMPCGHWFHFECIKAWLEENGTCPICRREYGMERGQARLDHRH